MNGWTLYTHICAFINYVQSVQLATRGHQSSSILVSGKRKANRMHLAIIWTATAKGLNAVVKERFQFLILNEFAKYFENVFSLIHCGLLCVEMKNCNFPIYKTNLQHIEMCKKVRRSESFLMWLLIKCILICFTNVLLCY